jgi:AraC-like DNA-binding protein
MRGSGTATFSDPDDYAASVSGARIHLVLTGSGDFKARLTWVRLPHLQLLRTRENLARVAYVSPAPDSLLVAFPMQLRPPPVWRGVELQAGSIVLQGPREGLHQRTSGPGQWGSISITPERLAAARKALNGRKLVSLATAGIVRPPAAVAAALLRVHAQACRLAETKPEIISSREVARAIEHELLHALVHCLARAGARDQASATRNHAGIMARFEEVLAAHGARPLSMEELCTAIDVPERTLRVACVKVLGMAPNRYIRLRRLNLVRAALRHADPATASVATIARQHGFSELGRFAASYRLAFGETPSVTLRGSMANIHDSVSAEFA